MVGESYYRPSGPISAITVKFFSTAVRSEVGTFAVGGRTWTGVPPGQAESWDLTRHGWLGGAPPSLTPGLASSA